MVQQQMYDLVILLPGILGSALRDKNGYVWAPSYGAIWNALARRPGLGERLLLRTDAGPDADNSEDGLWATELVWDAHLVPGLVKIDGYTMPRQVIRDVFDVTEGTLPVSHPANFYQFPYDWRRDNRFNARRLQRLIERALPEWREFSGEKNAKVIFVAHSMGGLVARYYLEVLEGWRDCKALISFGTPYRGSLNALNFLANGYKQMFQDLTAAMRSFPSAYQLLPIYPVVSAGGVFGRVAETEGIPGIDPALACDGLRFHREIEEAVKRHEQDREYLKHGYKILPFVGVRQPTLQSARLDGGGLAVSRNLPTGVDCWFDGGDGTVPQLSAVPIEMTSDFRETFVPERHSSLQNNAEVLDALAGRLVEMQVTRGEPVRGAAPRPASEEVAALAVDMDDLYLHGEPVGVQVRVEPARTSRAVERVDVKITLVEGEGAAVVRRELLRRAEDQWSVAVEGLPPGRYRIAIAAHAAQWTQVPPPVHDLFEVAEEAA